MVRSNAGLFKGRALSKPKTSTAAPHHGEPKERSR